MLRAVRTRAYVHREKDRDLTQPYDESPYTNRKFNRQHKTPPQTSTTQRLRTYPERSAGVTTAIQLVWLNQLTGTQNLSFMVKSYRFKFIDFDGQFDRQSD